MKKSKVAKPSAIAESIKKKRRETTWRGKKFRRKKKADVVEMPQLLRQKQEKTDAQSGKT